MSLDQFSKEDLLQMSLIEIAYELLKEKKQSMAFIDLLKEVANLLEMSEDEMKAKMSQFYTDLNIDGRFFALGGNTWGLRAWYPVEHVEEEVVAPTKPKKKKAKKAMLDDDLDLDIEDYDEVDEDDLDFDDLDDYDDDDIIEDDEDELLEDDDDDFGNVDDDDFDLDDDEDDSLDLDIDVDEDLDEEEEE